MAEPVLAHPFLDFALGGAPAHLVAGCNVVHHIVQKLLHAAGQLTTISKPIKLLKIAPCPGRAHEPRRPKQRSPCSRAGNRTCTGLFNSFQRSESLANARGKQTFEFADGLLLELLLVGALVEVQVT